MAVSKESCEVVSLPTKQDVVDFVAKVRAKALNAVKSKTEEEIKAEFEAALIKQRLNDLLEKAQEHLNQLVAALTAISEAIGFSFKDHRYGANDLVRIYYNLISLDSNTHTPVSIKEKLYYSNLVETSGIKEAQERSKKEQEKVADAYQVVAKTVERMRDPRKMIKYLDSLGFDTSYLYKHKKAALDPETLFPCKERA